MIFSISTKENTEYTIKNYIYDFETQIVNNNKASIPTNDSIQKEKELQNTALNSATTPDTGPETWILLLFTFLLSSIVYIKKLRK
jgi:hypothetical protein